MDYRKVAASLRRKAADSAVGPDEAATLLAKAAELEAKYGKAETPTDPPKRTYAPPTPGWFGFTITFPVEQWLEFDIVEEGYRYQPDDY